MKPEVKKWLILTTALALIVAAVALTSIKARKTDAPSSNDIDTPYSQQGLDAERKQR
jgi:hypothetical protein